jgi:hypothetical protein
VICGDTVTLGTITKDGGYLYTGGKSGAVVTVNAQRAGETVFDGTDGITSLTVLGGTFYYNSIGALAGAPTVAGMGVLDFSRDSRTKTVTNPIEVYGDNADESFIAAVESAGRVLQPVLALADGKWIVSGHRRVQAA